MKTKMTEVKANLAIWAIPRRHDFVEEGELPFRYVVKTDFDTPWQDGSTKVHTVETTLIVPAGIDLLASAIETLKEQIKTTRKESNEKIAKYEKQITNLALLEHKPETVSGGEIV